MVNSLNLFPLIAFVAMARMESISTIIFIMTSAIAAVGVTSQYVSSLLKKVSIRPKRSMSVCWLALTSLAACQFSVLALLDQAKRTLTIRRIPIPADITFAGENT